MSKGKIALYGVLALSLAINVFVAGAVVGRGGPPALRKGPPPGLAIEFNIRRLGRFLSEEGRRKARTIMMDERQGLRQGFEARREVEQDIRELLTADPVDKAALSLAIERHASLMQGLRGPLKTIMVDVIADEPLAVRQTILEEMFKKRRRRRALMEKPAYDPSDGTDAVRDAEAG